jgi:hypothetical protein
MERASIRDYSMCSAGGDILETWNHGCRRMNAVILNASRKDKVDEENNTPRIARDVERRTIVCHRIVVGLGWQKLRVEN